MNESYHAYECVTWHARISHVTHMSESCRTYEWVISRIWMCHVTRMNESCHTYEWVMSHIFMCEWRHIWINKSSVNKPYTVYSTHQEKCEWRHIWINKSSVNPKSTSNQSSKPCTVLPAQEWTNCTLISHERTSVHFLVLPGSLLSFTEITEYTYNSLI